MLAVKAYYDGQKYITDDSVTVKTNQRVIITFLDEFEPPKRNLKKYIGKISESDSDLVDKSMNDQYTNKMVSGSKKAFFDLAGKVHLDGNFVKELREASLV